MSSAQETRFLQLIKFSYDLSLRVTRTFMKTNILQNYNNSFADFLDVNKHELYHLWNNNTKCCACSSNALLQQNRELNKDQFIKLYDIQGTITSGHFKKGTGNSVLQHCMCGITCKASCSLNDFDITLFHTIIRKCVKLNQDDDLWLQTIREIRNKLAHASSTTSFDTGRLDKWWTKLEGSVLGLAGKVPPFDCYAEMVEQQIKLLRKTDLDKSDVHEFIYTITAENDQILRKQKEEIKEEIIHHLEQNKEILINIKNLIFEVKTQGLQQDVCDTTNLLPVKDPDTCYVEWRIQTPTAWQVEQIKEKLNLLKSLIQDSFKLEFVYVGSLVLETSIQRQHLTDNTLLISAVRSFLEKFVEVCDIETDTELTVSIDLSVLKHLRKDEVNTPTDNPMIEDILTEGRQNQATRPVESLKRTHTIQEQQSGNEKTFIQEVNQGLGIELCDLCKSQVKEVSSIRWCTECIVTLCEDCVHNHTEDHRTVDVDLKLDLQYIKSQEYCPEHNQQKVGYFCPVHDFICCQICLDNKHRSCKEVLSLDVACKNARRTIFEELGVEMNNINKSLAYIKEDINTNMSDINIESQHIERKIVEVKAKAIHQINESEKILLSELQDEKIKIITEQQEVMEKCQIISEKLVVRSNVAKFIKEHGTEKQVFILANHLKQTVDELDGSVATILSSRTKLTFDEEQNIFHYIPTLGRIIKLEQPSKVKHIPVKQNYAQCIAPRAKKSLTSFKSTFTFRPTDSVYIKGMIVTEDNKLLLCNYKNIEVLVYNDDGQYVSTMNMKGSPWDIAVIPCGNQYVVTLPDNRSIQYINSKDLTPGSCVKLSTSSRTYGIAADKQHIYVGEHKRIFVLNHDGSVVREIMLEDCGLVSFLAVNGNNIYASGLGSIIYCIDHNNTIRHNEVMGAGAIRKIIIDRQGYIYVGGEGSRKVHRLDKELNETMTIGDKSVNDIKAVCFNKDCTKLFVASEQEKTITVFSCS